MTHQPAVSVIVSTHNVGSWMQECLSSILDDQSCDLEVIVVDDDSTDDTWPIAAAIAANDVRLRLVRSVGSGVSQARNLGVELARGEYVVFCDGGDLVPREAFPRMLSCARASHADMVIGRFLTFWPNHTSRPTRKWPAADNRQVATTLRDSPSLIRNRTFCNVMICRRFWMAEKIYFPSVSGSADIVPISMALANATLVELITDVVYLCRARPHVDLPGASPAPLERYTHYLSQELECSAIVASLGDASLRAEYDELFLSRHGWESLRAFLTQIEHGASVQDPNSAQAYLVAILDSVSASSLARLPTERRWVYALAAAGSWQAAADLVSAVEPASKPMPDGAWFLEQCDTTETSPTLPVELMRRTLNDKLISPLIRGTFSVTPDLPTRLARHADIVRKIYPAKVRSRLPLSSQQLVQALMSGRPDVIRARLTEGFTALHVESVELHRGRVIAHATVGGRALEDLTFYMVSGASRRDLAQVELGTSEPRVEASIPVSRLLSGTWSMRMAARDSLSSVDAPVVSSTATVKGLGRRWARAVLLPQETSGRGKVLVVRRGSVRTGSRRLARALIRRLSGRR